MKVIGIDFTSRPTRRKPITRADFHLEGNHLRYLNHTAIASFRAFEAALEETGPWIMGIDFPFGQARRFVENIGWPSLWMDYATHAGTLDRTAFRAVLENYKRDRATGDKEHRRTTDRLAGAISPQKLYGVPVGLMFFEGAPRLAKSPATIPGLKCGDPERIIVEAYPGILARSIVGRRGYKTDTRSKQTEAQHQVRREIITRMLSGTLTKTYGLTVEAPADLADDPSGDELDALLCGVQAAWSWLKRDQRFGAPADLDPLEGWIADPHTHWL